MIGFFVFWYYETVFNRNSWRYSDQNWCCRQILGLCRCGQCVFCILNITNGNWFLILAFFFCKWQPSCFIFRYHLLLLILLSSQCSANEGLFGSKFQTGKYIIFFNKTFYFSIWNYVPNFLFLSTLCIFVNIPVRLNSVSCPGVVFLQEKI